MLYAYCELRKLNFVPVWAPGVYTLQRKERGGCYADGCKVFPKEVVFGCPFFFLLLYLIGREELKLDEERHTHVKRESASLMHLSRKCFCALAGRVAHVMEFPWMYAWRRACLGCYIHGRFQGSVSTTCGTLCSLLCIPGSTLCYYCGNLRVCASHKTQQITQYHHAGIMQPPAPHMDVRTQTRL